MINVNSLKRHILDLALKGKLVSQREEDGSAADMLSSFEQMKINQKSKKVKRAKEFSEIDDTEIPFEIPKNWVWCRWGKLLDVFSGVSYDKGDISNTGLRILRGGNIQNNLIELNDSDVFLPEKYFDDEKIIRKGDTIIVASTGSRELIGKPAYVKEEIPNTMVGAFLRICRPKFLELSDFFNVIFQSSLYRTHIRDASKGTNINNIKETYITLMPIPLPPIAEQRRIIEKINSIFGELDEVDRKINRLNTIESIFEKKIIQLGVEGKLTESLSFDDADNFLNYSRSCKRELNNSGVLKGRKTKPLLDIKEDDYPHAIPSRWKWIRLGDVCEIFGRIGFRGYTTGDIVQKGEGAITISPSNINSKGETDFNECTYLSWEKYEESPEIMIFEDDVLLVKTGSSYGKPGIVKNLPQKATINPQLAVLKYITCNKEFLNYVLLSDSSQKQFEDFVVGTAT